MLKFKLGTVEKNSSSSIGPPARINMSDKVSNTARQFLPCLQETRSYAIVFLEIASIPYVQLLCTVISKFSFYFDR